MPCTTRIFSILSYPQYASFFDADSMPCTTRIFSILTYPQYASALDGLVEKDWWFVCDGCEQWRKLPADADDPGSYRFCKDAGRECTEVEDQEHVMQRGEVSVCAIVNVHDMT